jgi:tetraacyldisaccharide 4'-kinase
MSYLLNVLSGTEGGPGATALRATTAAIEPFYAALMRTRNWMFDARWVSSHGLGRSTISIGNITTGGTGKTPMVRWLAQRLRERGRHVAVLARGYKSSSSAGGDEQIMLDRMLNCSGERRVELLADPNRMNAAASVLRSDPSIDLFILDDGFQHRRARRNLDLVLLSAPEPFGFGHVLPRGLLREPLSGLRRAGACVITHADQVSAEQLAAIEQQIHRFALDVPIYRAVHQHVGLRRGNETGKEAGESVGMLGQVPFFAFAGIGSPARLDRQLAEWGSTYRGKRWFDDHHAYSIRDLRELSDAARAAGAEVLLTTEKDWVKVIDLPRSNLAPIWRIEMAMRFLEDDEERLFAQILKAIESAGGEC